MNVSSVSPLASTRQSDAAADTSSTSDSAPSFAAVLSGMMTPPDKPKPAAEKKTDGTSELDAKKGDGASDGTATADAKASGDATSKDAASAKGAATPGASATDAATANAAIARSLALVTPALRTKVTRVMERMREETGRDVVVAETFRSQARQNALFAQGRETPGQVVTWTQHSKHSEGLAVDVTLPGGSLKDYAALQRIANEEGLHTLGSRDPGHLELPTPGMLAIDSAPTQGAADVHGAIPVARVAELARVASVSVAGAAGAAVATPARVAEPAKPAAVSTTPTAPGGIAARSPYGARTQTSSQDKGEQRGDSRGDRRSGYADALAGVRRSEYGSTIRAVSDASPVASSDRVSEMLDAKDAAPAARLAQITLAVDGDGGTTQQVQLSMRGRELSASIEAADSTGMHRMTSGAPELARALARDGIDLQQLHVRAAAPAAVLATDTSRNASNGSRGDRPGGGRQPFQQDAGHEQRRHSQRDQRGGKQK